MAQSSQAIQNVSIPPILHTAECRWFKGDRGEAPSTAACIMGGGAVFETRGALVCTIQKILNCTGGFVEKYC